MIHDGYSRHIRLKAKDGRSFNLVYRPLLSAELDRFTWLSKRLGEQRLQAEIYNWMRTHVVVSDVRNWEWLNKNYPDLFTQSFEVVCGVSPDSSGKRWCDLEQDYEQNLIDGTRLLKKDSKLANRSCEDCQKWWYDDKTGDVIIRNSTGEKELRPEGTVTMCRTSLGCPKGTPENQKSLNRANKWALRHYQQCKAIGIFPDDEIVKKNAVIIERVLAEKAK